MNKQIHNPSQFSPCQGRGKTAFSLVEIIITISIISLLAVVGYSANQKYQDNSKNAKVISSLQSINNALEQYIQDNNTLPTPDGNINYFKIDTSYAHAYEDSKTYGVYGLVTENTIPKMYLDEIPLDPRTNSYYSYGKTKNKNQFELACVQIINSVPMSKVIGNYNAEEGPYNLIREYNGPNFVYDNSKNNFPYNPYEFKFVAKISDIQGTIEVETTQGIKITDNNVISSLNIGVGDKIKVSIGSTAQIHFSDGSTSVIGDNNQDTLIEIKEINFKGKNNIATIVKLYLNAGSIWTKATHLDDNSGFEVSTSDLTAAVRGTIFGVTKDSISTKVIVIEGEIDIYKNGVFIETLIPNIGEILKAEINETINTKTTETETSIPQFVKYTDIRTSETITSINNTPNNTEVLNQSQEIELTADIEPITNNESANTPITSSEISTLTPTNPIPDNSPTTPTSPSIPTKVTISGYGCAACPDGYKQFSENRLGIACKYMKKGSADERVCKGVIGNDGKEVICAIEKPKTGFLQQGCSGRNEKNWTGVK